MALGRVGNACELISDTCNTGVGEGGKKGVFPSNYVSFSFHIFVRRVLTESILSQVEAVP